MIAAASVAAFRRDLERVVGRGLRRLSAFPHSKEMGRVLYAAAVGYATPIAAPGHFYSQAVIPKGRGGRPRRSRSVGAARRSVRAVGGSAAQRLVGARTRPGLTPRTVAAVVGGDKPGTTHLRILEAGRRRRTARPGATGPLPAQRIFGRGMVKFASRARNYVRRAAHPALAAFVRRSLRSV